jgi:hypothetical protein
MKLKAKNGYEDFFMDNKSSRDPANLKAKSIPESRVSEKRPRRSGRDRRKLYDIYFVTNSEFKERLNERRSGNERRDGWKRVNEWGSIPSKKDISNDDLI